MTINFRRLAGLPIIFALAWMLGGCAETSLPDPTGKGKIRGIAAIVDAPDVGFLIEERIIGEVAYKGVGGFDEYDDLSYNFNFDIFLPGEDDAIRLATQFIDVVRDTDYTLILTGSVDNPALVLWEDAEREWTGTETVFEAAFAHFSPQLGDVDLYFAAPDTPPVLGNEIGTLTNGERLPLQDFQQGNYEIILTVAGDPSSVLYTSANIDAVAVSSPLFVIFDSDPSITGPVAVSLINENGNATNIPDPSFPAQLRVYHANFSAGNVDVYFDDDFSSPVFSNIAFSELSNYLDLVNAATKLTMTAVGNPGAIVFENDIVVTIGAKRTITLVGDMATPFFNALNDQPRPLSTGPVLRISNLAINEDFINIYLLEPGTEITATTNATFFGLPSQVDTNYFSQVAGMYELTITSVTETTAIAPPLMLDLAVGDVVDIAILDTADPEAFELNIFDTL